MKAVGGAIKNAADAHPDWRIDRRFIYSASKRAAGTLTAEWPEVLAARLARRQERNPRRSVIRGPRRGDVSGLQRRSPLKTVWKMLAAEAGKAKQAGDVDRLAEIVGALRLIAEFQRREAE